MFLCYNDSMKELQSILIRATPKVHTMIKIEAAKKRMSMNTYILTAILEYIKREQEEKDE